MLQPVPTHVVKTEIRDIDVVHTHGEREPSHVIEAWLTWIKEHFLLNIEVNGNLRLADSHP